ALELAHPVELLSLPQRDRVPAGVAVRQGDDRRQTRRARDVAAGSPGPREAVILFNGIGGPLRPFIDCALTHDQATRVADELASRVIAHEVLAPAFRANPIF